MVVPIFDEETEQLIDSIPGGEIYRYVRKAYDHITKGAYFSSEEDVPKYDLEALDEIVKKMASKKFQMSEEEVWTQYEKISFYITAFRFERENERVSPC
ncbi:hypothetical protein [Psychrobacillus sp. L4]|uniref:hypothetical protein n=1 Tax=Psychrobacillus sp. L4 TaxID=3236892 RepID=UPI0036F2DA98